MKISGPSLAQVDRSSDLYRVLEQAHGRIAVKDATTWGGKAATEAAIRLNWVDLPETSAALLPRIAEVVARFKEQSRVVLSVAWVDLPLAQK